VARFGRVATYAPGELLATEGTRKRRRLLYVVIRGALHYQKRIRTERTSVVLALGPGDAGGFLTFFNDDPSPVSVLSSGRTTVFELDREGVQALTRSEPALAVKVLTALAQETAWRLEQVVERMTATSAWALDLSTQVSLFPLDSGR
jgi:CRP-like cAMP-binding protein